MKFSTKFQSNVSYEGLVEFSIDDLMGYCDDSYLAQFEVNPAKVSALVKSIAKDGLWQFPTVLTITDTDDTIIGGGRHRINASAIVMSEYGLNASGKAVKITAENQHDLTDIEDGVLCHVATVKDKAAAVQWLVTNNGSRSMTAAEKLEGDMFSGKITQLKERQRALATQLSAGFFGKITVTPETARALSAAVAKLIGKKFAFIPDALLTQIATVIVSTFTKNAASIDSNFSRTGYKQLIDLCASEAVTFVGEGGDNVTGSIFDKMAAEIVAPAKTSRSSGEKAGKLAEQASIIAQLQAKLAAAGLA